MSRTQKARSAFAVFASALVVVISIATLIALWAPRGTTFVDFAKTSDVAAPQALQRSEYGALGYMTLSQTVYGDIPPRIESHTTVFLLPLCANGVATLAIAALTVALARRGSRSGTLCRSGVMALNFLSVGLFLPLALLIAYSWVHWWPSGVRFVWPTSFLLVRTYGIVNGFWYETVAIAIVANALIFAAIGFCVSLVAKAIRVAV